MTDLAGARAPATLEARAHGAGPWGPATPRLRPGRHHRHASGAGGAHPAQGAPPLALAAFLLLSCHENATPKPGESSAAAFARAVSADTPADVALRACTETVSTHDECVAAVVRLHPTLPATTCRDLADPRWRGECAFAQAEHHARSGERWHALTACAVAGTFQDECLYHAWSFEMQARAEGLRHAVNGFLTADSPLRESVAYWSAIETLGPAAHATISRDAWYFAHARNKPAHAAACDRLEDGTTRAACRAGTLDYVRRYVVEHLQRAAPELRDRVCRSGVAEAHTVLDPVYAADPALDAAFHEGLTLACSGTPGQRQAWSPTFLPRRGFVQ